MSSRKKIHIVDYGVGNLLSVARAFERIGADIKVTDKAHEVCDAEFLVLPGVGAFPKGMKQLETAGLKESILEYACKERPLLGICLGMQMLFNSSEENGVTEGLGLIEGTVKKITPSDPLCRIPHIGWSKLRSAHGAIDGTYVYFVHSYHPITDKQYCVANAQYEDISITAMVKKNNIWGCQFHPEKSGVVGLSLLKKILDL